MCNRGLAALPATSVATPAQELPITNAHPALAEAISAPTSAGWSALLQLGPTLQPIPAMPAIKAAHYASGQQSTTAQGAKPGWLFEFTCTTRCPIGYTVNKLNVC